jgi:hypothetical protein
MRNPLLVFTVFMVTGAVQASAAAAEQSRQAQPRTVRKTTATLGQTQGHSGADYSLDHLARFYQYPRQEGRPALAFQTGGEYRPSRSTVRPTGESNAPSRLAIPKSTSKGPGGIKAPPVPATVCATDDAVGQNDGDSKDDPKEDPGAAYDRIATASRASATPLRLSTRKASQSAGGKETRSSGPPAIHRWPEIIDCPSDEKAKLKEAWALVHDYVWAANAMLTFIDYAYPAWRPLLWSNGHDSNLNDAEDGKSNAVDAANWSPRAWFGGYSGDRLSRAQDVVNDLWWRIRNEEIRIDCDLGPGVQGEGGIVDEDTWSACHQKNPGSEGGPDAYHFPQGKIAVCRSLFDKAGTSEYATRFIARLLTHETSHWIKFEDGAGNWVKDAHTIWCKNEGPETNHVCHWANDKMYTTTPTSSGAWAAP